MLEGESGLEDRSSRPHNSPRATPSEKVQEIITMRKEGKMTGDNIARVLNMPQRTVSRHLIRAELSRQEDIEPRDSEQGGRNTMHARSGR